MTSNIDRSSPIPYYFQLTTILEHEITSGRWGVGAQIPSEPALSEQYGVSRSVVRQALTRLEQSGLVARRKGEGTFVNREQPRTWLVQSSQGLFQDEVQRAGRLVTSTVLRIDVAPLPNWASHALKQEPQSPGVWLERVRMIDDLVAVYVVNHLPVHFAETVTSAINAQSSLYEALADAHGVRPSGGTRTVEAVTAGDRLASVLEIAPSSAVAFIESVSWDREQTPFDCYRAWVRTDRMKIDIQVAAAPGGAPVGVGDGLVAGQPA